MEPKVIELCNIEIETSYSGNRKKPISEARILLCYWCVSELGESMTCVAKLLGLNQPRRLTEIAEKVHFWMDTSYAVDLGERLAKKENHNLLD